MKINGACHCGNITIEGEADIERVTVCHCTDCQTSTGTAFRFNVPVRGDTFKMTGEPTIYIKTTAESGTPRAQAFCPRCGSPIYSTSPGEGRQASYMVRAGILAQRDQLMPKRQIWFRSARAWATNLDAVPKHQKQG
ncbi:MAG: GFA family protein [Pseudolabrys sp.]